MTDKELRIIESIKELDVAQLSFSDLILCRNALFSKLKELDVLINKEYSKSGDEP